MYDWEAKVLAVSDRKLTLSQLKLKGCKEEYASHLNLSMHRLNCTSIEGFRKGMHVFFSARPGYYVTEGVRRGTIDQSEAFTINIKNQ